MGCDIHCTWEIRRKDVWVNMDNWELCDGEEYCGEESDETSPGIVGPEIIEGRHYNLFAIMADVRNGWGFAGCDTGDSVEPIALPRGVPKDASAEFLAWVDDWDGLVHSPSWLSVHDIVSYDWTKKVIRQGVVTPNVYSKWGDLNRKDGKSPLRFCSWVAGEGIVVVSEEEFNLMSESLKADANKDIYIIVEWVESLYQAGGELLNKALPIMVAKSKKENLSYHDVRLTFFFDN